MAAKPKKQADYKEVTYSSARWALLGNTEKRLHG
jgi:hypothetical protein